MQMADTTASEVKRPNLRKELSEAVAVHGIPSVVKE